MHDTFLRRTSLGAISLACLFGGTAHAADADASVATIEREIHALQSALAQVKSDAARHDAELARARAAVAAAREEARAATRRANALVNAGPHSFAGEPAGGIGGASAPNGASSLFTAETFPQNGVGPHPIWSVGQQQASGLGRSGMFRIGGVTVQLGGFLEALMINRTRNEVGDYVTSFGSIPYANKSTYHESEFRGTARQSRLSLLIEGNPSKTQSVAAYFETDFGSAGTTSNSNESNSYTLRMRQAYATWDNADLNLHILAGHAWSLLTMNRIGIVPRQENTTLAPEGQFEVGFNWTRGWQIRVVKDFDNHRIWAGLSLESPATVYTVNSTTDVGAIGRTVNYANAGGSLLNSLSTYSDDIAPDLVGKLAFDPSFGHYEIYGVGHLMHTRDVVTATGAGENHTVVSGGGGAGLLIPFGKRWRLRASGLVGTGIGRFASGQLPDATIGPEGEPVPIPEVEALLGVFFHPSNSWDLYAYLGTEQEEKRSFNESFRGSLPTYSYGYGNGYYDDSGCDIEGATSCSGQTRGLVEGTIGTWWRFLHGSFGTMQVGTAWSYVRRTAFEGSTYNSAGQITGSVTPKTDNNIILVSFRYLPFL